jgi:hypothetical protein
MVVFTVDFKDVTERSLARLFLQQFAGVQKQVAQSPHIEFRRSNEPPKEILDLGGPWCSRIIFDLFRISLVYFLSIARQNDRAKRQSCRAHG